MHIAVITIAYSNTEGTESGKKEAERGMNHNGLMIQNIKKCKTYQDQNNYAIKKSHKSKAAF
ncbi:hypothetical protein SDC9_193278 [bioreactor metagenome]|uniref:Uncharacterized protein n=1 Tax=bioreactor metagenome TaxID=1076179 RepID=A0A645I383_9ZZZZ